MQVAIDNAKRKFDIDLVEEIKLIKNDMNIKENGYPVFWTVIRRDFNKPAEIIQKQMQKIQSGKMQEDEMFQVTGRASAAEALEYLQLQYNKKNKINYDLICPMNYIYNVKFNGYRSPDSVIDIEKFYVKYELDASRRQSKKVEELIEKYNLDIYNFYMDEDNARDASENYLLLRSDYDDLINEIKSTYLSKDYLGLMSWLINRTFCIGSGVKSKKGTMRTIIDKNKAMLLKILYDINSESLLKCFSGKKYEKTGNN